MSPFARAALSYWLAVTSALAAGGTGAPHGDELAYAKRAALECDALAADKHSRTVKLIEVDLDSDSPRWERVAAGSDQEVGASLTVRLKNERVRVAESHRPAPSGDWELDVKYCFREDGKLAALQSELRTFQGDVVVRHSRYFGLSGETIQDTRAVLDLTSGKPVREGNRSFMDRKFRVYQTADEVIAEVGHDRVYP
jgi:hypothetical protein